MKPMKLIFNGMVYGGFIVGVLLICYFGLIERPYLSYANLPLPVLSPTVKPGEAVRLLVKRCNTEDGPRAYNVARTLVPLYGDGNGLPYVIPASAATVLPGCTTVESQLNVIPAGVPPGRYYIDGVAEVRGTFRSFVVGWQSQPFDVEAP